MLKTALTLLGVAWALGISSVASAQTPVRVIAVDDQGGLVSGVDVTLQCQSLNRVVTDTGGEAESTVSPGRCTVSVTRAQESGSVTFDVGTDEVEILATLRAEVEFVVDGASIREQVEKQVVVAEPGTVQLTVQSLDGSAFVSGAQVFVRGRDDEASTDADGKVTLMLPPGTYDLSVVHSNYSAQTVQQVVVVSNKTTTRAVSMSPAAVALEDFTVTAPRIEGSVADTISERKQSTQVAEVLGADEMAKNGSSNAADALSRVTGITVVGGKFVYVRGLGDRYSMTLLGGANLPSPEPEKRVVPLDLFPADMLASVLVQKSYSADMPGEFGGGVVVLRTAEVPTVFEAKVGVSVGANTETTFREGLSSPGGSLDFLGIDDGTRSLPDEVARASESAPLKEGDIFGNGGYTAEELERFGELLPNTWAAQTRTVPPNFGLNASLGVPFKLGSGDSGVRVGLVYDHDWSVRDRIQRYYVVGSGGQLEESNSYQFNEVTRNVVLGGILTTGWNLADKQKIKLTTIFDRVTDGEDRQYVGFNRDVDTDIRVTRYRWLERQLFFQQVLGEHDLFTDMRLKWNYAFSQARRNEPDRRETRFDLRPNGAFQLSDRPEGNSRVFSELVDNSHSAQASIEQKLEMWSVEMLLVGGGAFTLKNREVDTRRFKYFGDTLDPELFQQGPEVIFTPANIGPGLQFNEITRPTDNYRASQQIGAGFAKLEMSFGEAVDVVVGARLEYSDQSVETFELFSVNQSPVTADLATLDVMPHVGLNWFAAQDVIVRASASRNVSRPDFRELSPQLFNDVTGGLAVQGNPELDRALITHADARVEWYFSETEFASIGGFFKYFQNPIESVIVPGAQQLKTFENADSATNLGLELEVRTGFGMLSESLRDLYLSVNLGLVRSRVSIDSSTGVQTSDERRLQGQSPYIINAQAGYDNVDSGTRLAALFNLVGPRISEVGSFGAPDIFEVPGASLDVVFKQDLGAGFSAGAKLKNLLNSRVVFEQGEFETASFRTGVGVSASLSKTF